VELSISALRLEIDDTGRARVHAEIEGVWYCVMREEHTLAD
jgi:hypothetical protein